MKYITSAILLTLFLTGCQHKQPPHPENQGSSRKEQTQKEPSRKEPTKSQSSKSQETSRKDPSQKGSSRKESNKPQPNQKGNKDIHNSSDKDRCPPGSRDCKNN